MTIARVDAIPVSYPEPNDSGAIRHLCFVRTVADDGTVGWGESITQWPEASLATREIVRGLAPLVVGSDPQHLDATWHRMLDHVWWYGYRGGIALNAIAAIDMSLWDLAGKVAGRSVLDLLGGPVHDRLPAIVSCHASRSDIDELVEEMATWVGEDLHGIKIGFGKRGDARLGFEHDRDVEFVRKLRDALGPRKQIMVDLGIANKWDVATAVRRTRAFEEFDLAWIEEPLGAWDPDGYRDLRANTATLIGYGEREWEPAGFERILRTGTVDVVGVDPGRVGGISGFRRIAELVHTHRRQVNAHAWSSAITTAASLALSLSSPAAKLFEMKPLRNPMQHELVEQPFAHAGGYMYAPAGAGLGVTVREDVVEKYRFDG